MNRELLYSLPDALFRRLLIRNKGSALEPLILNTGQRRLLEVVRKQREAGQPVRIVLLKARQFGGSTLAQALLFLDTYLNPRRESWVVAHNLESTRALCSISRRFLAGDAAARPTNKDNSSELILHNRSRIFASTADNVSTGRGFTIHNLHASEVAYWRDTRAAMQSLLQAVPDHADTCVIIESTANGLGGWFYDLWRAAGAGETCFSPVFVGWSDVAEYTSDFVSPAHRDRFLDGLHDEEIVLLEQHGLTPEQLLWRRNCIRDKCGGDEDVFRQEYPLHDQEAFLTCGRPVFSMPTLSAMYSSTTEPGLQGEVNMELFAGWNGKDDLPADKNLIEAVPRGRLKIWRRPAPGAHYVIGVDVAEGIEVGQGSREHDNSCIQVLRRVSADPRTATAQQGEHDLPPGMAWERLEQAACWTGKIDPDALADVVLCLARHYNNAFVGVEANNHGLTTLTALKGRYPYLYQREFFDERGRHRTQKLGWLTTMSTRPVLLDALRRAVRERALLLHDTGTLAECMTFVFDRNGRMAAQEGCFDDRVFALAIAVQMHLRGPVFAEKQQSEDPAQQRLDFLRRVRNSPRGAFAGGWNIV